MALSRAVSRKAFTLIEMLVVIALVSILAVVVVVALNPAELLKQTRDANRLRDMATLTAALNLYTTDLSPNLNLGTTTNTYISVPDPNSSLTCGSLGMLPHSSSSWACSTPSAYRAVSSNGWIPVNFNKISMGAPFGSLPVDPVNQTSSGLFYTYNADGNHFEVTATLESQKYKSQYGENVQTSLFPGVVSGGTPSLSALYNPVGLVGYWPLNEGTGSSTIDESGNGNTGTWVGNSIGDDGVHYTEGKVGAYAGIFDGSSNAVNLGASSTLEPSSSLSVFAWANLSSLTAYRSIVSNIYNGRGPLVLETGNNQNVQCLMLNNTKAVVSPLNTFNHTGVWYFVGCTYDGSQVTLYINGAVVGSTPASGTLSYYYTTPWYIGAFGAGTPLGDFPGRIDDARIYNRALSSGEVMALYNSEK